MILISEQIPADGGNNLYQILAIISLSISSCSSGTMFTWTSPSIPILTSEEFPGEITLDQTSYLTVIPPLATIIGSVVFSLLMDKIGRKKTLLLIAFPHFFVWIIVMFTESIYILYISRVFYGFADGGLFTTMPTYMSEITTPCIRGSWGNIITLAFFLGQLLMNSIGGYCSIKITAYILATLPVLYFLTFSFMPESPYYLIMKERREEARNSLMFLRQKRNVDDELKQLYADIQRQSSESGKWKDLFLNPTHRNPFIAGTCVRAAQPLSGMAAFSTYTAYFFQQAGSDFSFTASAIIFSSLLFGMNIISSIILDKLGRRLAMIISCSGCAVTLLSISIYFYIKDYTDIDVATITWFPMLGLFSFVISFSIGLGIVPTLLIGEIFSTSIKAKGVCALQMMFSIYICAVPKLFQYLITNHGMFSPFLLFGSCCVFNTIMSFYLVPETTGKTLEEIQQSMKTNRK